jgi:hypothetical protein
MNSSCHPSSTYSCPAKLVRAEILHKLSTDVHQEIHDMSYTISKYDSFTGILLYVPTLIFYELKTISVLCILGVGAHTLERWNRFWRTLEHT